MFGLSIDVVVISFKLEYIYDLSSKLYDEFTMILYNQLVYISVVAVSLSKFED